MLNTQSVVSSPGVATEKRRELKKAAALLLVRK